MCRVIKPNNGLSWVKGLLLPLIFGLMATLFIAQAAFAAVTLLTDGFESNFDKWTDGGTTNWDRATSQKHSGSYSGQYGGSQIPGRFWLDIYTIRKL